MCRLKYSKRHDVLHGQKNDRSRLPVLAKAVLSASRSVSMATLSVSATQLLLLSLSRPVFSSAKHCSHAYYFPFPFRNPNPNHRLVTVSSTNRPFRSMPELLNSSSMADPAESVTLRDICRNHVPEHVLRR